MSNFCHSSGISDYATLAVPRADLWVTGRREERSLRAAGYREWRIPPIPSYPHRAPPPGHPPYSVVIFGPRCGLCMAAAVLWSRLHRPRLKEREREKGGWREREERGNEGRREECPRNSKWNTNTHSVPQIEEGICLEKKKTTATGARTAPFPYSHSPVASSRKIVFKEGNQMERSGGTAGYQVTPPSAVALLSCSVSGI